MDKLIFSFIELVVKNYSVEEIELIKKTLIFAVEKHFNQYRKSNEPYIIHPLMVAKILCIYKADANTICAGLLHDVIEDTNTTKEDIENIFNQDIANMVDGVTKIKGLTYLSKEEGKNLYIRKVITSVLEDSRIIIIKLVDRLHNMCTLSFQSLDKQDKIAKETMDIYVPLAYYLGIYRIKFVLEDLAFKYLDKENYDKTIKRRNEIIVDNDEIMKNIIRKLEKVFAQRGIRVKLERRTKNIYGIYKRLVNGMKISDIGDILRIKVIVDDIMDCYQVFGIIHGLYRPYNEKFKDYISNPKTNMYKAIHTTVFTDSNQLVQFQIRTKEMNLFDNLGIITYWQNHNVHRNIQDDIVSNFQFARKLKQINDECISTDEFMRKLYEDILKTEIYLYYNDGNVLEMPKGSRLVDLYQRITEENIEITINDDIRDLYYELKTKDRIFVRHKFLENDKTKENHLIKRMY